CHRGARRRYVAAALATLEPVDACPLAHIIRVSRATIELALLEARHESGLRVVPLAVRVGCREAHVEPGPGEQAFLDADDHGQVEDGVVRGDLDRRFHWGG